MDTPFQQHTVGLELEVGAEDWTDTALHSKHPHTKKRKAKHIRASEMSQYNETGLPPQARQSKSHSWNPEWKERESQLSKAVSLISTHA